MKKITTIVLTVLALLGSQAFAQNNSQGQTINCVNTAVPFLNLSPDSRAGGMGDIGCATSADVNSQSYNPAKYVFSDNMFGFSLSYSPWLHTLHLGDGINLAYLSAYYRPTKMDAIGFSFRYFDYGSFLYTEDGIFGVDHHPKEFSIDLTYSRKLIDELSIAITPRFIYSNLTLGQFVDGQETKPGLAGAADLSLFYQQDFRAKGLFNSTLRAGLNISNIAFMKMSYSSGSSRRDFLPTNLKLGIGYEMDFDGHHKLAINGEINKLLVPTPPVYATDGIGRIIYDNNGNPVIAAGKDPNVSAPMGMIQSFYDAPGGFKEEMQEVMWALGAEYSYRNFIFARLGYFHESQYKGDRQFISLGVGIKYNIFSLDMAYLIATKQYHPLANTLRFTVSFDFVSAKKDEIKRQGRPWGKYSENETKN